MAASGITTAVDQHSPAAWCFEGQCATAAACLRDGCPTRKLQAHCLRCCEVNSLISVVISFSLEAVGCCPVGGGDVVVSAPHARLLTADGTNVRLMEAFHVSYLLAKDC